MSDPDTHDRDGDPDARWRAEFRAFVRAHHPDRGGDPAVFVAGLARFAAHRPATAPDPAPASSDASRYDRPIEFTTPHPLPLRIAIALLRTVRKQRRDRTVQ